MYPVADNFFIVETEKDLPDFRKSKKIYVDFETNSGTPDRGGNKPWKDVIAGMSITSDDRDECYYIPVRHNTFGVAIDADVFRKWLDDLMSTEGDWVNHNIKFDAALQHRETGRMTKRRLVDTLVKAKIYETDRLGHALKPLCREWLEMEMSGEEKRIAFMQNAKTKNFADCPADILGFYACEDVAGCKKLDQFLDENLPEEQAELLETEIRLTKILHRMEMQGFPVFVSELKVEQLRVLKALILNESKIARLAGYEFSNSKQWIYELLVVTYDLPVLAYNEKTGKPTFNKKAMEMYERHPVVRSNPKLLALVKAIRAYRKDRQFLGLFINVFLEERDDDNVVHPFYTQILRTGRMACKKPNIQQQSERSKKFIRPRPGYGFISVDYSQIEFRLIAHYAEDEAVIRAYNEDRSADFHTLTASLIYNCPQSEIKKPQRRKSKFVNFGVGFGAGKKKVLSMLLADNDFMDEVVAEHPDATQEEIETIAELKASQIYETYHERMPGIKRVSNKAASVCKSRGYVFNAYKRRRHLPKKFCHKAFNAIVQGGAMDIIKERFVELDSDPVLLAADCRIVANVHDEFLFEIPLARLYDTTIHERIISIAESPRVKFSVPITVGLGVSPTNWYEASSDVPFNGTFGKCR